MQEQIDEINAKLQYLVTHSHNIRFRDIIILFISEIRIESSLERRPTCKPGRLLLSLVCIRARRLLTVLLYHLRIGYNSFVDGRRRASYDVYVQ